MIKSINPCNQLIYHFVINGWSHNTCISNWSLVLDTWHNDSNRNNFCGIKCHSGWENLFINWIFSKLQLFFLHWTNMRCLWRLPRFLLALWKSDIGSQKLYIESIFRKFNDQTGWWHQLTLLHPLGKVKNSRMSYFPPNLVITRFPLIKWVDDTN